MSALAPPFSPASSPPSSPCSGYVDSSPPASPPPNFPPLDDEPGIAPHPYAASSYSLKSRSDKRLKFTNSSGSNDHKFISVDTSRILGFTSSFESDGYLNDYEPVIARPVRVEDQETELWNKQLEDAIEYFEGPVRYIRLDSQNVTMIPPTILDLNNLVFIRTQGSGNDASLDHRRELLRTQTEVPNPARAAQRTRSLRMTQSITSQVFGTATALSSKPQIHMYLSNNRLRVLPNELFRLDNLVVLTLRANKLTEIPGIISQLRNLEHLNVGSNKLKYLPAEMMDMKLKTLMVHPNPFLPTPADSSDGRIFDSEARRSGNAIPSLSETIIRLLMTPTVNQRTLLEDIYGYPLSSTWSEELPNHLLKLLNSCLPGCLASQVTLDTTPRAARDLTGQRTLSSESNFISTCPSPSHRIIREGSTYRRPVYIQHAEERITWEPVIAGVEMTGGSKLSCIPVKWRGCSWGCLDFLSSERGESKNLDTLHWDASRDTGGDTDVDDDGFEPVPIQFTSEGFEFDD